MDEVLEYIALGNAVLIASFLFVWIFEFGLKQSRFRHAYKLRLNLSVAALCAAGIPFVLSPISDLVSSLASFNAHELVVAQYLKGNINVSATQLADVLTAKNNLIDNLISTTSIVSQAIILAFLLAAFLRACYIGISILQVSRLVRHSKKHLQTRRVQVRISDEINVPFSTRGLFNYYIVLPRALMNDVRAVRIAVGHEAQHIRHRDVDWEILLSLVSPVFVLNPGFWFLSDRIRRFREYSCDAVFLHRRHFEPKEYCMLLLEIASRAKNDRRATNKATLATSVPFFGRDGFFDRSSRGALRKRVVALASGTGVLQSKHGRYFNLVPAVILLCLMVVFVSFASRPTDWSQDRLMLSTVVNLERLDRINGFGVAPLR